MLKVSAKDFGPIIEGTVELKPLTVFVGPSNSGKSYFATLIYALLQATSGDYVSQYSRYSWPFNVDFEPGQAMLIPGLDIEIGEEVREAVKGWIEGINVGNPDSVEFRFQFDSLPLAVQSLVNEIVKNSLSSSIERFNRELQRCHGEIAELRRRSNSATLIQVDLEKSLPLLGLSASESSDPGQISLLRQDFDISQTVVNLYWFEIQQLQSALTPRRIPRRRNLSRIQNSAYLDFYATLVSSAMHQLFQGFPGNSYYLPAARSGIAQGHKAISSILVRQSPFAGLRPLEIPTLSGIITDFISHILTMERGFRENTELPLSKEVNFLEHDVVHGKIDIEAGRQFTYPEIYYQPFAGQPDTEKFPLHKTSSMVSELAPVILFLKHLVRPGDLLILEEPESHLHPASQRQMARGIVRLVNAGVKVIITTHSDYFVGQLNNLLQVSRASPQKRKRDGFEVADCLKAEDVSAYHFQPDEADGGSRVIPLNITPGFGIDAPDFAKVSEALYEETISLQRIRAK